MAAVRVHHRRISAGWTKLRGSDSIFILPSQRDTQRAYAPSGLCFSPRAATVHPHVPHASSARVGSCSSSYSYSIRLALLHTLRSVPPLRLPWESHPLVPRPVGLSRHRTVHLRQLSPGVRNFLPRFAWNRAFERDCILNYAWSRWMLRHGLVRTPRKAHCEEACICVVSSHCNRTHVALCGDVRCARVRTKRRRGLCARNHFNVRDVRRWICSLCCANSRVPKSWNV
mmetsp:Transcript_11592/g.25053  ORF Transcript_11592/g.25053 Transcript_11592/m.25053 type:complete len:228 (-) Transcript_11592:1003-1686(-)